MRKFVFVSLVLAAISAQAGGLITNTNQNIAFNRMMSREASIGIDGVYSNPAGVAFMPEGTHLSFNLQSAFQTREVENDFALFANNLDNPTTTHNFKGKAVAPVIPSVQFAYNKNKWSFQANFAVGGGGGKCKFEDGLGSFEQAVSGIAMKNVLSAIIGQQVTNMVPTLMGQGMTQEEAIAYATNAITTNSATMQQLQLAAAQNAKYKMNAYMRGRQYYYGLSLGAAYKLNNNLAVFAGLRGVLGMASYYGYVKDVEVAGTPAGMEISLDCDQSGFGLTPILGIDYRINDKWNASARFEFKTRMRLKNKSDNNIPNVDEIKTALEKFDDGKKIAEDIPALFTVGVGYKPIKNLQINVGAHYFFDKQATTYGDHQKLLDKGTTEINAGIEYDASKLVTVSAGWQSTNYGLTDAFMDDKSFVVNSNSIGAGVCLHLSKKVDLNVAYFTTLYGHYKTEESVAGGYTYKSDYTRTNNVLGVGVDIHF